MLKGFVSGEEKDIRRIPMGTRNLFDWDTAYGAYKQSNNCYKATLGAFYVIRVVPFTSDDIGKTYTFSFTINELPTDARNVRASANVNGTSVHGNYLSAPGITTVTFTVSSENDYLYINYSAGGTGDMTISNIMLNLGSTALPYEPYGYQEGWEIRDNQDRLIWGREDELQTATGTLPFKGYSLPAKVKSLLGNAVQNGTPAPDNIVMPEMCGVRTGNLINLSEQTISFTNLTVHAKGSVVTFEGNGFSDEVFGANAKWKTLTFDLPAGTYRINHTPRPVNFTGMQVNVYDSSDNRIAGEGVGTTFTLQEDTTCHLGFYVYKQKEDGVYTYNIMLNAGSTALPYEPFGWAEKITCAGQTIPIYLGQVQTVRAIGKVMFDGSENWNFSVYPYLDDFITYGQNYLRQKSNICICSHLQTSANVQSGDTITPDTCCFNIGTTGGLFYYKDTSVSSLSSFKSWLQQQYAAGTPVTVWYVLAAEQTGIVNEPLAKIGTYADELTTIQVHGLSAPLYGIGDYKDTLNLSTGVVTRKVKKLVLTGQEQWSLWSSGQPDVERYYYKWGKSTPSGSGLICTHLPYRNTDGNFEHIRLGGSSRDDFVIYISKTIAPTVTDFKAYLTAQYQAGTPVTAWYVLSTPTTETVTVPTGMTGEIEGYLTQVSTPTPTNRSVPKWNGVEETGGTYAVTVYTPPEIPTTTGQNTLTVDSNLAPSKLEVSVHAKKIHYGFKIDKSNDNSEDAVIYTHDAVTMTPAHMDFTNDRFDYGSWGNAFFVRDCYPVALNLDGTEAYRLDPDDYTKKMDGTPSDIFYELLATEPSDWSTQWKQYYTKSGDEYVLNSQSEAPTFETDTYYKLTYNSSFTGNFMMAFPKVWFYRHEDSQYNYIEISNHKLSDDWKCYAHINANGQEVDFIYLPLFKGVIKDSKLRSLPGQIPQGGTTATTEVNAATALGSRWQIWDHSSVELINDLLTLMSKSIDSQGRFGKGRESGYNSTDTVTYGKLQTGTLIKSGKFYGFSSSYKEVKVFGLEGFWANRWDRLQGMLLVNNVWKIKMTPPYNFTGTDFVTLSNASVPTGNGYLSKVQTSEYGSIPASADGDSSTKYFKDYFYKTATDTRAAIRGGYCDYGARCGFRYVGVYSTASTSHWSIGASPVYK